MKYEFEFKMDEETLYDFYKSYNGSGLTGKMRPVLGVAAIVLAILSSEAAIIYRLLYVMFGALFLFYMPWELKRKAKKQVATNPYYAEPIHYILDEEGVTTTQGEKSANVTWVDFSKLKLSNKSMILYMRNRSACVWPLKVFGEEQEQARQWIEEKLSSKKSK